MKKNIYLGLLGVWLMSPPKPDDTPEQSSTNSTFSSYPPTVVARHFAEESSTLNFLNNFYDNANIDEKKVSAPSNITSNTLSVAPSIAHSHNGPSNESAQASSPEVSPKLSPATEASSQHSSDQGESPANVDLEKEKLRRELMEAQTEILQLNVRLLKSEGEQLVILQKSEGEQLKLMKQIFQMMQSDQQIMLQDLEPETKKRFEKRNLK